MNKEQQAKGGEMKGLREKIDEAIRVAMWKVDTRKSSGKKLMPTHKEHKNLLGGKELYVEAIKSAVLSLFPLKEEEK